MISCVFLLTLERIYYEARVKQTHKRYDESIQNIFKISFFISSISSIPVPVFKETEIHASVLIYDL